MAGRNDAAIPAALEAVAQAVGQQPTANAGATLTLIHWFYRLGLRHRLWPLHHWFDRTLRLLVLCNQ